MFHPHCHLGYPDLQDNAQPDTNDVFRRIFLVEVELANRLCNAYAILSIWINRFFTITYARTWH